MPPTETRRLPRLLLGAAGALAIAHGLVLLEEREHPPHYPDRVHWLPALQGQAQAADAGKPVLYDFSADWCGPCNRMKVEVFADPVVAESIERDFVPVRILDEYQGMDPSEEKEEERLRQRHGATGLPTLVVVDGENVKQQMGYSGRGETVDFLRGGWRNAFDFAGMMGSAQHEKDERDGGVRRVTTALGGFRWLDGGAVVCAPRPGDAGCDGGACDGGS